MKKLIRPLVLVLGVLAVFAQGCNNNRDSEDDDFPEAAEWKQPASKTVVIEFPDTEPDTMRYNWQDVVIAESPGTFISAIISKKGGSNGPANGSVKTTVRLQLDRKEVLMQSFELARAMGLSEQNYSGVVRLTPETDVAAERDIETLVLGYSEALYFVERLIVGVKVDDPEVKKVFLSVAYTKKDAGEDEDTGGGDSHTNFP